MEEKLVAVVAIPGGPGPFALRQDIRVMGNAESQASPS